MGVSENNNVMGLSLETLDGVYVHKQSYRGIRLTDFLGLSLDMFNGILLEQCFLGSIK